MGLIDTLRIELANPSYAGMTDQQAADSLNEKNKTRERSSLSASELFQAMDLGELNALPGGDQARVNRILALGTIDLTAGSNPRVELLAVFSGAAGARTRPAIGVAVTETISRATELGLSHVWPGYVQTARL